MPNNKSLKSFVISFDDGDDGFKPERSITCKHLFITKQKTKRVKKQLVVTKPIIDMSKMVKRSIVMEEIDFFNELFDL